MTGTTEETQALDLVREECSQLSARLETIARNPGENPPLELRRIAGRLRQIAAVTGDPVPGGVIPADQPLNILLDQTETALATDTSEQTMQAGTRHI